jgi:glycosyltransferase involved in cell wall biosynthesis
MSGARTRRGERPTGERVRVLYCIDNFGIGGTELNAVKTAERLDRTRFDVSLMCLQEDGPLRARYEAAGIPIVTLPLGGFASWRAVVQGVRFVRYLVAKRVDVVHSHDMYSNFFATLWARVASVPLVIASRRWWHTLPARRHRLTNAIGFRLAHRVLANSPAVGESLVKDERISREKVWVVPNFVDDHAFESMDAARRATLLLELGVPPDAEVLGVIARLDPVKNHRLLLRAVASLVDRRLKVHLIIVGDGPCRSALETEAQRLGIASHVHFAGSRPNVPNLHVLFDVSVLSSDSEGFPNTLLEAMAVGRPIVATRVGGTVDAVIDGGCGILVPAGDEAGLAIAIEDLLRDPDKRRDLGLAGRQRARELFHQSRVLERLEQLYIEGVSSPLRAHPNAPVKGVHSAIEPQ